MQHQHKKYKNKQDFYFNYLIKINEKIVKSSTRDDHDRTKILLGERKKLINEINLKKINFTNYQNEQLQQSFIDITTRLQKQAEKLKHEIISIRKVKKVMNNYQLGK